MHTKKILVTGANGQLGQCLQEISSVYPQYDFVFADRTLMPLDKQAQMAEYINDIQPDIIINTAAYTAVDKAESEPELAFAVNADAVGFLGELTAQKNIKLIHISTDYVFNGEGVTPYLENHSTAPINIYGASKLKGEQLLLAANPEACIIRTSWVYSQYGNNFVKTMLRLLNSRESINVVNDQVGSPTNAMDLANAIMTIAGQEDISGIYHFANTGVISWYDFAKTIGREIKSACVVNAIPSKDYPTPARRPYYSVMDTSKISLKLKTEIPDWLSSLKKTLDLLQHTG
ncbi:dTDP-4-dehydrorhamnose reductase [Polluticaenibacter yanchengensis]|uniref:dTDP-4-dehydrorhamnose reductase n=1 Tax=Polluticaenibacter yanchengensis TaxID=3014562 RepID=A0ABT4UEQ1_9BACT|nr:dTDP-4-dehydrorhamnose reductase [Chitinophagaceae bacterium LY-5]